MHNFFNSVLSKLTRITSGGKLIKEIDGLRFIAIIPVLIQHFSERFQRNTISVYEIQSVDQYINLLASRGFLGVYIFFVISGFVLALPFAAHKFQDKKKVHVSSYFWRRLTRLEPPYVLWITVFFIIAVLNHRLSFIEDLPHYLASITYTHSLIYHEWSPINPPTWTLEIEIQFYILAPFLSMFFFQIKNKYLRRGFNTLVILVLMLVQQHFLLFRNPYSLTILGHLQYFLIGFMLVDIYLNDWAKIESKALYDYIGIISLAALIYSWSWDFELLNRFLTIICLFIFFISAFKGIYLNKFLTNKWITAIGGMCYTIYLIHLPFAEFWILFTKRVQITSQYSVDFVIQLICFLFVVLMISSFFYIWVERPFMNKNWPREFYSKLKTYF